MKGLAVVVAAVVALGVGGLGRQEPNPIPLIHGIASFAIPGLGQYLNGEYNKALVHFGVAVGIGIVGGTSRGSFPPRAFPSTGGGARVHGVGPLLRVGRLHRGPAPGGAEPQGLPDGVRPELLGAPAGTGADRRSR